MKDTVSTIKNNSKELNIKATGKNLVEKFQKNDVLEYQTDSKNKNISFYDFLEKEVGNKINLSNKVKERISTCGDFLQFLGDENIEHIKLENANFCGNRFCPQCSANKSREDALQIATMCQFLKETNGYEYIFLTLTAPNIPAEMVSEELKIYSRAFKKLQETKAFKKINKGYIRKLEMTYSAERDDYHPHYHVLIAVNKSYFTQSSEYISHKQWLKMWQKAKGDNTITQVDIQKFKSTEDFFKSVFELSKYIAKNSDYMHSADVFKVFYNNLKGKRMLSFSGCFKNAVKLYKNGDLEQYMGEDPNKNIKYVKRLWYAWNSGDYEEVQSQELTPEEIEKANLTRQEKFALKKQKRLEIAKQNQQEAKERQEELSKIKMRVKAKQTKRFVENAKKANMIIKNYNLTWQTFYLLTDKKYKNLDLAYILNRSKSLINYKKNHNNKIKPDNIIYMLCGVKKLKQFILKNNVPDIKLSWEIWERWEKNN